MNSNLSAMEISELVSTRISHDIIGNVGAVSNAVELLEEDDLEFIGEIKSILKTSSFTLSARMKFFRMAFGLNNANLDNLELVEKTLKDYIQTIGGNNNQVQVNISLDDGTFSKIALLSAMIAGDTFIRGGTISIKQEGGALAVYSDNNSLMKDKVFIIKEVMNGNINDALAQYAPILYLKNILENSGCRLSVAKSEKLEFIIDKDK
ncbi:MAG: hypothetical protein LBR70_03170 [Lactobacillaceae bacterium]|jgi:hypothetical protein|nr:hypothetical protein [Lactobacillaceae bacterium]